MQTIKNNMQNGGKIYKPSEICEILRPVFESAPIYKAVLILSIIRYKNMGWCCMTGRDRILLQKIVGYAGEACRYVLREETLPKNEDNELEP